jgi:hypothetical protein
MMQVKKITLLLGFVLIHILVVGCSSCDKKKGNRLAREEKRLKNNLKEQCKETAWKPLEESFEQDRNSFDKINQHIQRLLTLQGEIENLEKFLPTLIPKFAGNGIFTSTEKQKLQSLVDFLSPLKQFPEELSNKTIDELLQKDKSSLQKFSGLLSPIVMQVIKTFLTNQLDLWRNLKQQLEQKTTEGDSESN